MPLITLIQDQEQAEIDRLLEISNQATVHNTYLIQDENGAPLFLIDDHRPGAVADVRDLIKGLQALIFKPPEPVDDRGADQKDT